MDFWELVEQKHLQAWWLDVLPYYYCTVCSINHWIHECTLF